MKYLWRALSKSLANFWHAAIITMIIIELINYKLLVLFS